MQALKLKESLIGTLQTAGLGKPAELAEHILGEKPPEASRLPTEQTMALVMLDADSIQTEIATSPRPVTMSGASSFILEWDTTLLEQRLPPGTTILYSGGGNAVLLTPREALATLPSILEESFRRFTKATATAGWLPVSPRELVFGRQTLSHDEKKLRELGITSTSKGFAGCISALRFQVQLRKQRPASKNRSPLEGERCVECHLRERQANSPRCQVCQLRREKGGHDKDDIRTFQELLHVNSRMAFVYLDGRGIGERFTQRQTVSEYYNFSRALTEAFAEPDLTLLPTRQILLSGGDDLLFVAPLAWSGGDVFTSVNAIIDRINKTANVDVGVGIVITGTLSADFCIERAAQLCKHAKSKQKEGSVVDYEHILEGSPFSDDIAQMRRDEALDAGAAPPVPGLRKLLRTQRPYSAQEFAKLVEQARKLQTIPRSQLAILLDAFAPGRDPATAFITLLYQASRGDDDARSLRSALELPEKLNRMDDLPHHLLRAHPVDQAKGVWDTGLCDLIELSGLLRQPEAAQGDDR